MDKNNFKEFPWPQNLIAANYGDNQTETGKCPDLNDDQMDGLIYILDLLDEKARVAIYLHYSEGETLNQIARYLSLTTSDIKTLLRESLAFMRKPENAAFYINGLQKERRNRKSQKIIDITEWKQFLSH